MSFLPRKKREYKDGRTKQAFKDSTDINKILQRAQREGTLSHINKYGGEYADYSDFDFMEAQVRLARARQIFDELPSEVKREFGNNPSSFFEYANDPANQADLVKKLPSLAKPGRQRIEPVRGANPRTPIEPVADGQPAPPAPPAEPAPTN